MTCVHKTNVICIAPTIRALISIENYLTSSDNFTISFDHVYHSLEEKVKDTVPIYFVFFH